MAKATQPVTINDIEFDALITESRKFEAEIPQYSVETGFSVSDAILIGAESLEMTLYVTNTPVTWYSKHGGDQSRVATVCKQLEELFYKHETVTVTTSDATYTDMGIESLEITKDADNGYSREIPISFKKVRTTSASTTTIPDSYGKSGTTTTSAGTASTSSGSTSSSGSSNSNTNTNTSSDDDSSSSSSGSVLWNWYNNFSSGSSSSSKSSSSSSKSASHQLHSALEELY